nr:ABC transporter ATP-binding protein [Membranihabitans maritimus]
MIAKKIYKSYDDLEVLKGVDLQVNTGEIISIQGKSGAGKSTFLQILGSLDYPNSGEILYEGENIFNKSQKDLAKFRNTNLGFVFQFHHLLDEFTAVENVGIPAMIGGKLRKEEIVNKSEELLDFIGLGQRKKHYPKELSGGEQQRVAIARALVNDPSYLLADEPTGNLDSENSQQILALFKKLQKELNQTIVVVTHDVGFAKKCDRIAYMEDGIITKLTEN